MKIIILIKYYLKNNKKATVYIVNKKTNIIIKFTKRGMKGILFGDLRISLLQIDKKKPMIFKKVLAPSPTEHNIQSLLKINKELDYKLSNVRHGCTAIVLKNNFVAFSMHTSKGKSKIYGNEVENIKINEELNPIEYTNPIQYVTLENFKSYFDMSADPREMLSSNRYGKNEEEDLLYCCLRAYKIALDSKEGALLINMDNVPAEITNNFEILENNTVLTPAQVLLKKLTKDQQKEALEEVHYEITSIIDDIEKKAISKKEFLDRAIIRHRGLIEEIYTPEDV